MSDTLRCTKCRRDLPVDDFSMDRKPSCLKLRGGRRWNCRMCSNAVGAVRHNQNLQLVREAKDVPCMDCGKRYPFWIMQFDHVRGEKLFVLSSTSSRALQKVKNEIAKCDVVCANCHADRTYQSKQYLHPDGRSWTFRRTQTPSPSLSDALTLF